MTTARTTPERLIPALSYRVLTRLYDPLMRTLLREATWKRQLMGAAALQTGEQVLDLGCGTGTLTLMLKQQYPQTTIIGLDADPEALSIAQKKRASSGLDVALDQGVAIALPYADASFDCVLSSLLFHHLSREQTIQTAREVVRVLKPAGRFLVADWGKAETLWMRLAFLPVQLLDGFTTTQKNVEGNLPSLFVDADLVQVEQVQSFPTLFGSLSIAQARRRTGDAPQTPHTHQLGSCRC
jgi:SAM-dependent methyltransferase